MDLSTVMLIILLEAIILSLAAVGVITWWLARRSRQAQKATTDSGAVTEELTLPDDLHAQTRKYLNDELERTRALRLGPGSQLPVAPEVMEVRIIALEAELRALDVANQPDAAWRTLAEELAPLTAALNNTENKPSDPPGSTGG
ncbi:MAG: hypothetical protein LAT50_05365 [Ectothiorhodospiraceae bacterium]|nr:hypothetical protein [Ectothiorhodospiraceae bacterium]